jgi:hypothetical protein
MDKPITRENPKAPTQFELCKEFEFRSKYVRIVTSNNEDHPDYKEHNKQARLLQALYPDYMKELINRKT